MWATKEEGGLVFSCDSSSCPCHHQSPQQEKPQKVEKCVFCEKLKDAPIGVSIFEPLNPVVPGHLLVVHKEHSKDAGDDPAITAVVMGEAAKYIKKNGGEWNIITSIGKNATQSVFHLHVHLVPRKEGDGLKLPWTGQKKLEAHPQPNEPQQESLDELVRDLTKVGSIPKSEAKRRIENLLTQEKERAYQEGRDVEHLSHIKDAEFADSIAQEAKELGVKETREKIRKIVEDRIKNLPYEPRLFQNRNGLDYCGTCEQGWYDCACAARNTGWKNALTQLLGKMKENDTK